MPPIDPDDPRRGPRRERGRKSAALTPLDPGAAARLNPGDTTRIARALEVVRSTGTNAGRMAGGASGGIGDAIGAIAALILLPPRDWLYRALRPSASPRWSIEGALGEVEALARARPRPRLAGDARDRRARTRARCCAGR